MENDKTTALFVGGNADGWTKEIDKIEPRINWYGSFYLSRGALETKNFGTVQVYVLEGMTDDEENKRMNSIKQSI